MHLAVLHSKLAFDEHPYPLERPQRRAKAVCRRTFHQSHLQLPQFFCTQQGRPSAFAHVAQGVDGAEFELFVRFMREHPNVWSKVSCPERLTVSGPPALNGEAAAYRDVVPFARRIVETFPDRVLWGTDWPHPNLKDHMPDDGLLVDFIPHIAPTAALQQKLLVDNPMRLYWPEEVN